MRTGVFINRWLMRFEFKQTDFGSQGNLGYIGVLRIAKTFIIFGIA